MVMQSKQTSHIELAKEVKQLIELLQDEYTPAFAIKEVLPLLFELRNTYPHIFKKVNMTNALRRIPFNSKFFGDSYAKLRRFATQEGIKDINGLTVDQKCILLKESAQVKEKTQEVLAHAFPHRGWYNGSNILFKTFASAKKRKNKLFHKNLSSMALASRKLSGGKKQFAIPEVMARIVSFMDQETIKITADL